MIEINRSVLEQLVKDKEYMYTVIANWTAETSEHYSWYGLGLHNGRRHLILRPRGRTQISIKYEDYAAECWSDVRHIEKRILMYKSKR